MMSESLDSRKFDRKPMFDVPLPMRKAQTTSMTAAADDSGNEGTATPPPITNTMAFSLMTKKGNRQQVSVNNSSDLCSLLIIHARLVRSKCHPTLILLSH